MSRPSAFVVGLSMLVLAASLIQCSDHKSNKHKTGPNVELDHLDGFSGSHRPRSHGAHVSVVKVSKTGKDLNVEDYEMADKKEFNRILEQSERIKTERLKKNVQSPVNGNKKKGANKKKGKKSRCNGYTCEMEDKCGFAPLNALSPGLKSSPQTGRRSKKKKIDSYMINGTPQVYGEWPSYVRIETQWSYYARSICGGTIISDRHILTAAHCMYDPNTGKDRAEVDKIAVILGEDRIGVPDDNERTVEVEDICVSKKFEEMVPEDVENFNSESETGAVRIKKVNSLNKTSDETLEEESVAKYDFAVLTLKEAISFTDYHQPSCLPKGKLKLMSINYNEDPQCYLVGSGVIAFEQDGQQTMAKTVEKMRMRRTSCEAYGFGRRDESRECYTKADSEGDSCSGDSGGPILCLDDNTKRWSVVGLVSYGSSKCNGEGNIGWVGVYTRVTRLLPIIKNECGV